jgi:hypothetical protein
VTRNVLFTKPGQIIFVLFLTQKSRIPGRLQEGVSDIQCRLLVLLENEVLNFQPINSVLHNPFDLKLRL